MDSEQQVKKVIAFVRANTSIEIEVSDREIKGVWGGCEIIEGNVLVSSKTLPHPGSLLHEIGHVATTPKPLRRFMSYDLQGFGNKCIKYQEKKEITECFLSYSDDSAATFWGFCVSNAIGLDSSLIFREGYEDSKVQWNPEHRGFALHRTCLASDRSAIGTTFSCSAFYLGLTNSKGTITIDKWELDV